MVQQDKQLFLADLCARLPYGLKIQVKEWATVDTELKIGHINRLQNDDIELKPYLRPMSSMTDEEYSELKAIAKYYGFAPFEYIYDWCPNYEVTDWLNAHHFDYRDLIQKGQAIAIDENNNPYKE